ncbi:hypothetical protein Rs2_22486 [Raphanus sativus]|uniref:Uncharacterized protein LOC108856742 n=1 Tax=Raphanus sativus TaxID=3726 RepID=A0A6J0NPQ1_RAPSA|nr:uncharacterized protein LOC108856742 [Raphanus sativus]KAJ4895692.1 hypothetical protein Rs2_22486 [Raphanus sativus]
MPQVNLETSVPSAHDPMIRPVPISVPSPVDFPPESYSVSKEAELEWFNENAFFERKGSQRGISSSAQNVHNSNSQRVSSLKSKTSSIIRLPKPQKTCFNEVTKQRRNCRIARTLMIPKRIGSRLKSEPSSPKVSCIGRVRSKRDRSRRIQRQRSGRTDSFKDNKPVPVKKPGFLATFRAIFRTGGGCKSLTATGAHAPQREVAVPARRSSDIRERLPPGDVGKSSPPRKSLGREEPVLPGLGGVTRFKSGRRPDLLVEV